MLKGVLCKRQTDPDRGSLADLAFCAYGASMCFDNGFGDRQSQAGFTSLGARRVGAVESVKDMRQRIGRNPLAIILYTEYHLILLTCRTENDLPACGRVAQGIADQVAEDLRHPVRVQVDFGKPAPAVQLPPG